MYDEAEKKEKMFEAGAEGYILKTVSADELLAAIRGKKAELKEQLAVGTDPSSAGEGATGPAP